ncbi:MAG: GNAT family N-acetyltransferase [archaeon]
MVNITEKVITDISGFDSLKEEWDALVNNCIESNIFMTFEWAKHWIRHTHMKKPLIICIYEKGSICAIAPFYLDNKKIIRVLGHPYSDYEGLIGSQSNLFEIYDRIFKLLSQESWNSLEIDQFPSGNAFHSLKYYLMASKKRHILKDALPYQRIDFKKRGIKYSTLLSSKRDIRRKMRVFEISNKLSYRIAIDKEEILNAISMIVLLHTNKLNSFGKKSQFENSEFRSSYSKLILSLFKNNDLDMFELLLDKKPISCIVGLKHKNKYHSFSIHMNIDYIRISPGILAVLSDIERIEKESYEVYNFGRGRDEYKARFSNSADITNRVSVFNNKISYFTGKTASVFSK